MASLTIRPGARVRLKGQDDHVPDFYVVHCDYEYCWIRQQNWNPEVVISVQFSQIFVPEPWATGAASSAPMTRGGVALALPSLVPTAVAVAGGGAPQNAPQIRSSPMPHNVIDMAAYRQRRGR